MTNRTSSALARARKIGSSVGPCICAMLLAICSGCALERHKDVEVISQPPGARIEVNGDFVGCAPTMIKMLGNSDGTVQRDYTVRAYPMEPEFYPQVKLFLRRTVGESGTIPKRLFFDMRVRQPEDRPVGADEPGAPKRRRPWP